MTDVTCYATYRVFIKKNNIRFGCFLSCSIVVLPTFCRILGIVRRWSSAPSCAQRMNAGQHADHERGRYGDCVLRFLEHNSVSGHELKLRNIRKYYYRQFNEMNDSYIGCLFLVKPLSIVVHRRPDFYIVVNAGRGQIGQRRMRLHAIDYMLIGFHQHHQLAASAVPSKDVAAIRTGHHIVVAPEGRFFDHRSALGTWRLVAERNK